MASQHGCRNLGLVRGFDDVYLFEKHIQSPDRVHRTKRELEAHPCVAWADPQEPLERVKRGYITTRHVTAHHISTPAGSAHFKNPYDRGVYANFAPSSDHLFNDELWVHQWYLQDNTNVAQLQSDIELHVEDVWKMGYTGQGVVVAILDDGLEWNHTDIMPNYDHRASWDMNNNRSNPFPRYDALNSNSHGTKCAGEIAMVANNLKCGVGVAPRARIGGIKCLDGEVDDRVESSSLLHNMDYIDIYSGSWGPADNGLTVDGPKRLATQALEMGTKYGRQGKGVLYVWANGNGGAAGDNCNCDGYVNSIYTISIGAVTQQGQLPLYGERCPSTIAVTCSSGAYTDRKIVTTDLHNKCTIDYTGTSAAAPLASGIFALLLEANRNLTWRDVQHLTAWTSDPLPIRDNPGWKRNSAGLIFNSRFGFGLLNAKALVDAALKWQTVPKKSICILSPSSKMPAFLQSRTMAQAWFVSDGCQREFENQQRQAQFFAAAAAATNHGQQPKQMVAATSGGVGGRSRWTQPGLISDSAINTPSPVIYVEHVQLIVDIEYTNRGSLDIFLISPSGTVSTLLTRRPFDKSRAGFDRWPLMSLHFWGESSIGKWTVIVRDKDGQNNRGLLRNATLLLHGTTLRPAHMAQKRVYEGESQVQSFIDPVLELDEDDIYDLNTFPNEMSLVRDDSFQPTMTKAFVAQEQMKHHS